jgi:integrase
MTLLSPALAVLAHKLALKPMSQTYPYKPAVLRDSNGDISKIWYVEFYVFSEQDQKLKRKRIVVAQPTVEARHKFAKEQIIATNKLLAKGAIINPIKQTKAENHINDSTNIQEAFKLYLKHKSNILKPNSLASIQVDINRFNVYLAQLNLVNTHIAKIDQNLVYKFLDYMTADLGTSNRSRNNTLAGLSTIWNFFVKRKLITDNPFKQIDKLPQVATKHTAFSDRQVADFKAECLKTNQTQLWLFLNFIYYTFGRPREEVRGLQVGDIKQKTIVFKAQNSKEGKTEHVMIPPPLEQLIQDHKLRTYPEHYFIFTLKGIPDIKPCGELYMYNRHVKILKKLKIYGQNLDTYSWKHTGVIALWRQTQNLELIRQQCRHTSISSTIKYLRDLGQFVDYDQINKFPEI